MSTWMGWWEYSFHCWSVSYCFPWCWRCVESFFWMLITSGRGGLIWGDILARSFGRIWWELRMDGRILSWWGFCSSSKRKSKIRFDPLVKTDFQRNRHTRPADSQVELDITYIATSICRCNRESPKYGSCLECWWERYSWTMCGRGNRGKMLFRELSSIVSRVKADNYGGSGVTLGSLLGREVEKDAVLSLQSHSLRSILWFSNMFALDNRNKVERCQ